jgi:hypothetical protein
MQIRNVSSILTNFTIPIRSKPLMCLNFVQISSKLGRSSALPSQHCWIRRDKWLGQSGGSCGFIPLSTLSLNVFTVGLQSWSVGKGVGSPVSTAKQISPKLYTSAFLGWHLSGSWSACWMHTFQVPWTWLNQCSLSGLHMRYYPFWLLWCQSQIF